MIALIVITDGRSMILKRTLASLKKQVSGPITERYICDDSGHPGIHKLIRKWHPEYTLVTHPSGNRQGFSGNIRNAWANLREVSEADYVFHLEDDFTFNVPVDLEDLRAILDHRPNLSQVAYLRQAWNVTEKEAGGVIQEHPDWYSSHHDDERDWLEQDQFFTTNPSLYRRNLLDQYDWPDVDRSEGAFSVQLREDGYSFGYWGEAGDDPVVHHIGKHRQGIGY